MTWFQVFTTLRRKGKIMSDIKTQTPQSNPDPKPSSKSRRMRWILIASLGVNLAIVGLVAGAALRGGYHDSDVRARAMQSRDFGFGPYVAALDASERRVIGRAFIGKAGRPDKAHNAVQAKFEAILDAIKADPFEAQVLKTQMLTQLNDLAELQRIGADVITDHIAAMTPEARAAYAVRLDQALQRPPRRDKSRDEGRPPKP
jgi:uncharacterized membrane protein